MNRLFVIVAVTFVCAVVSGCSAALERGARDQAADKVNIARLATCGDVNSMRVSSDVLPSYESVAGLSGSITSIGASTTTNLVARAAVQFRKMYPNVTLQFTSSMTNLGPSALLESRADIVPMSRPLKPEEIQAFAAKFGYAPTEIKVAGDALAIFVEKGNPVRGLTLEQLDGIFCQTQRRGGSSIERWGQVGLTQDWADRPIILYGYDRDDGAHQIFRQQLLEGGAFRLSLRVERGGSSIVQGVAAVPGAIGFASVFFTCQRVRAVPIAGADGTFYAPTAENVRSRRYPLSRFLYICVNKPPRRPLAGPTAEFLRFLLSREGQQIVTDGGNFPLDAAAVKESKRGLAE